MQYADFATYAIALCDRMFTYNRYPYSCSSVQRALLAPEILNESFLKCRYFTALYSFNLLLTAAAAVTGVCCQVRNKVYTCIVSLRPANLVYYQSRSPAELLKSSGLTQVNVLVLLLV